MKAAWWWIDRWRKSTAYTDMTLAEQGAYRNLLDELWLRDGIIPKDERILAKIAGDMKGWAKVRVAVLARFTSTPDGLRNITHDEIQKESKRKADGQKRYRDKRRNVTGNVKANRAGHVNDDVPRSPSPSPSLTDITDLSSKLSTPARNAPTKNALVDRPKLEAAWHELIPRVAVAADLDPTEVARKVTDYQGRGYVNVAGMSDDRLAQSMIALRKWDREIRGVAEPVMLKPVGRSPPHEPQIDPAAQAVVEQVLAYVRPRIDPHLFRMWFSGCTGIGLDGQVLRVGVQRQDVADWLVKKYGELVSEASANVGIPGLVVKFEVA